MRYRHLIWDWNGTLLDDTQTCVNVLNTLCHRYHRQPTTLEQYRREFGFPVARFYEHLGFDFTKDSYDQVARDYIALYTQQQRNCRLHRNGRAVLQQCRTFHLGQSILSAYHQSLLEEIVEFFGIRPFFDHLVGLSDLHAKSKVAAGQCLMDDIECEPDEVLLIGDTIHDHEVAQILGVDCLLIPNGHQTPERLHACGRPLLADLEYIPTWLNQESPSQAMLESE